MPAAAGATGNENVRAEAIHPYRWGVFRKTVHAAAGATAWSMLFGWADAQAAAGNPRWVNKWGVYQQNGEVNTPNTVAPVVVNGGVNNIQMEIRSYIGGFCLFSAGPPGRGKLVGPICTRSAAPGPGWPW